MRKLKGWLCVGTPFILLTAYGMYKDMEGTLVMLGGITASLLIIYGSNLIRNNYR